MKRHSIFRQKGAVTLLIAVGMLVASSMLTIFSAESSMMQEKMNSNIARNEQAFESAEAGLNYGFVHFSKNQKLITPDPANYSSNATQNVSLTNGGEYTIQYSQLDPAEPNLIKVTVTGKSADNTSKKVLAQLVKYIPILATRPQNPLTIRGSAELSGDSEIANPTSTITIWSGGNTTFQGSASTVNSNNQKSRKNNIKEDVVANDSNLANTSKDNFFKNFFGRSKDQVKSMADTYIDNGDYSGLNGKQNEVIWLEKPGGIVHVNQGIIGSLENPVILIVNGTLTLSGPVEIYGYVYVTGSVDKISGTANIYGAVATEENFIPLGTSNITYNPYILDQLDANFGSITRIIGSWLDF